MNMWEVEAIEARILVAQLDNPLTSRELKMLVPVAELRAILDDRTELLERIQTYISGVEAGQAFKDSEPLQEP